MTISVSTTINNGRDITLLVSETALIEPVPTGVDVIASAIPSETDESFWGSFTYTQAGGRVKSDKVNPSVEMDMESAQKIMESVVEFAGDIRKHFTAIETPRLPYALEAGYNKNEVSLKLKIDGVNAFDARYNPQTRTVKIKQDALDLSYSNFLFWLHSVLDYFALVELHRREFRSGLT